MSPADAQMKKLRHQISDVDRAIVDLVNKRLELVVQMKRYKDAHGIDFVDLTREEWMLQYLQRANRGPLSADGLERLFHHLLALMKEEAVAQEQAAAVR